MTALLRRDRDTGYTWVDFYADQLNWAETVTRHQSDEASPVVDATGFDALLTIRSTRGDVAMVLDTDDIENGGTAGTYSWEVSLAGLHEPVYDYDLVLTPPTGPSFTEFRGRLVIRPVIESSSST